MNKIVCLVCVFLMLAGCVTTTLPDGSTTQKVDYELASFALESAVTVYNLYLATTDVDNPPEQSRLTELLNNIERIEVIVNRLRDDFGKGNVSITKKADGMLEVKQ